MYFFDCVPSMHYISNVAVTQMLLLHTVLIYFLQCDGHRKGQLPLPHRPSPRGLPSRIIVHQAYCQAAAGPREQHTPRQLGRDPSPEGDAGCGAPLPTSFVCVCYYFY